MRKRTLLMTIALLGTSPLIARAQGTRAQGNQKGASGAANSVKAEPPKAKEETAAPLLQARGPQRLDFDDRLVQGQTNKLGAVYLYQRKAPAQPSLLVRRNTFRQEIARDLLE